MTDYLPEQSLSYKTFVKNILVAALTDVFKNHPDPILQHTRSSVEYPKDEADYPTVIIRFFERELTNAGIGHYEWVKIDGESKGSSEVDITVGGPNTSVLLSWDGIQGASKYRVYRASSPGIFDGYFETNKTNFTDDGSDLLSGDLPTVSTASFVNPQNPTGVASPGGSLLPGTYRYRVTGVAPTQVFKFQHYMYTGDIEFAIYGLSSYDRDLVADTIVQTLTMGKLEDYTNRFFIKVFADNFPKSSNVHIISFNNDLIQGFGENQAPVPWQQTDSLVYTTAYRIKIWGEFYNIPPTVPFGVVEKVLLYPYLKDIDPVPAGLPNNANPWQP